MRMDTIGGRKFLTAYLISFFLIASVLSVFYFSDIFPGLPVIQRYNPVLWGVPKGSYASNPNGPSRTIEFRKMVQVRITFFCL